MAQKLQLHPFLVNLYLAKRSFVLEMPWHFFQANLQCMIDFNVPSINILKDLWSFRYHPEVVKMRLQKGKRARMKSLKPWIVRCTEPILNKLVTVFQSDVPSVVLSILSDSSFVIILQVITN